MPVSARPKRNSMQELPNGTACPRKPKPRAPATWLGAATRCINAPTTGRERKPRLPRQQQTPATTRPPAAACYDGP
eukprot:11217240-Lingulodinium_polyedra.AAC.1